MFATATLPLMAPITDGLNVIAKVHLEAGAKEPPQGVKLVPTAVKSALAVRAEMFTAVGPLLVKVTVFAAAVVPINSFEKTVLVGLKVREAADPPVPLPVSATICVANEALVTLRLPFIVPFCFGLKVKEIVHFPLATRLEPHGVVVPPVAVKVALARKLKLIPLERLLVRVTVLITLLLPTATLPKDALVGESDTAFNPVPLRFTNCGEEASSAMVTMPGMNPTVDGLKMIVIVHCEPVLSVEGQLLDGM